MSLDLFKVLKDDFFEFYPQEIKTSPDPDFRILADIINRLTDELVNKNSGKDLDLTIEDLNSFYIPEQSPEKILPYLAHMVGYEYDRSKSVRDLRNIIFSQVKLNKRVGTVNYLLNSVEETTGIRPTFVTKQGAVYTGWDQNSTIDGNPENVDFQGGIGWDQEGSFIDSMQINDFRWFVKTSNSFLDIKNNGVFDPDPDRNNKILNRVYANVARYKDASVPVVVGYLNSSTGAEVYLKYVYSRDIISSTEEVAEGYIDNNDNGIEN